MKAKTNKIKGRTVQSSAPKKSTHLQNKETKEPPASEPRTRKSFDFSRDSVYAADPLDLCIQGGRGVLPPEESGPLDTVDDSNVSVKDRRRLQRPLKPQLVEAAAIHGIKKSIIIAKISDAATVIDGKTSVRVLRAANHLRAQRGLPTLTIKCTVQRDTSREAIMTTMVLLNNHRQEDVLADKIEKARELLDVGVSEEKVAMLLLIELATLRDWLVFDDTANDDTKAAVSDGLISASVGIELAKAKNPDAQRAALTKLLTSGTGAGTKKRSVRAVRADVLRSEGRIPPLERKLQKQLIKRLTSELEQQADVINPRKRTSTARHFSAVYAPRSCSRPGAGSRRR